MSQVDAGRDLVVEDFTENWRIVRNGCDVIFRFEDEADAERAAMVMQTAIATGFKVEIRPQSFTAKRK